MTATTVNGVAVIGDEALQTPLSKALGQPVYYTRIRRLLLADGTSVVGCTATAECTYTADSPQRVSSHLRAHSDSVKVPGTVLGMSVGELLEIGGRLDAQDLHIDRLIENRDYWKERCLLAEKSHDAILRAAKILTDATRGR